MVAKKTATKKPIKKVVASKVTPKKTTVKRTATKKTPQMQSFRVYRDDRPFVRAQLTRQTVYWVILLIFIVITQLWILKIQMDIADLTALLSAE